MLGKNLQYLTFSTATLGFWLSVAGFGLSVGFCGFSCAVVVFWHSICRFDGSRETFLNCWEKHAFLALTPVNYTQEDSDVFFFLYLWQYKWLCSLLPKQVRFIISTKVTTNEVYMNNTRIWCSVTYRVIGSTEPLFCCHGCFSCKSIRKQVFMKIPVRLQ